MPEIKAIAKPEVKAISKKEKVNKKRLDVIKRFYVETKAEFRKIVWPTPKTVVNNTIVVLVTIMVVGIFIWILDALSSTVLNAILKNYA